MRAGLARVVTAQLSCNSDLAVDNVCEEAIRENILEGQPAALACPHKDCGILAVRVRSSGMTRLWLKYSRDSPATELPRQCTLCCREFTPYSAYCCLSRVQLIALL